MQNSEVSLVWTTPDGQNLISEMARVSNPKNAKNYETAPKLLRFLTKHGHWSPFELANMCVSIKTSRAIGRQLLRHRSFSFQEMSQRYTSPFVIEDFDLGFTSARLQDTKNRQNSIEVDDEVFDLGWKEVQERLVSYITQVYQEARDKDIAKEVARCILPEGLTPTHIYMNGTIRSWIHFCQLRCGNGTQKETTQIANSVREILIEHYPEVWAAVYEE